MQNIFKDHNCKVIIQFNSHRKYMELSAYFSLHWGQNCVFLASKIRKLHFSKWAFDNHLLFQSTEFKTPLLTVVCLRQKCQLFNSAKHRKCKLRVYTKHKDDYSFICTYRPELTISAHRNQKIQLLMAACILLVPNYHHLIKYI